MTMSRIVLLPFILIVLQAAAQDDLLDSLWNVYQQGRDSRTRLQALDEISHALRTTQPDSSIAVTKLLLTQASAARDTPMIAEAYRNAGLAKIFLGEFEQAAKMVDTALTLFVQRDDEESLLGAARSHSNLGYIHRSLGHMETSMDHCFRSIPYFIAADQRDGLIYAYNDIGQIHHRQGRADSAIHYYVKVVDMSKELGQDHTVSWGYNNIGLVYRDLGMIAESIDLAYRSLEIMERVGDVSGVAGNLINISDLKAMLGETEGALEVMREAHRLSMEVNDVRYIAHTSGGIGSLLMEMGDLDSAMIMLDKALSLEKEYGLHAEMGNTMPALGKVYRLLGRTDDADRILNEMLRIARDTGEAPTETWALTELGQLEIARGRYDSALAFCNKALDLAVSTKAAPAEQSSCECLYLAYKGKGRGMKAVEFLERATDIRDRVFDETAKRQITQRDLLFNFEKQQLADSLRYAGELVQLENERTIEKLRADQNRNRMWATGGGAMLLLAGGGFTFMADRKRRKERFEKEAATLETQALRSQMNPHFIFNALNSINAYVQRNDQDMASSYLSKFARVMRLVLENSRHSEVPLKDDLEALRGYLDLERMRMDKRFDFSIDVDPAIDPEEVMVPPLVVQPFVENAIWHGMAGKESGGKILLKVARNGKQLIWTIEDNGAGRQAKKAQTDQPVKKTSLGTAITRARLDLVQKQHGGEAGFHYTDLPQGTRVEVQMPLLSAF